MSIPFWPVKSIITQSSPLFSYTPDKLLRFIWRRQIYLDLCLLADTAMSVNLAQSRQCWLQTLHSYCAGSYRIPALQLTFTTMGCSSHMGSSDIFPCAVPQCTSTGRILPGFGLRRWLCSPSIPSVQQDQCWPCQQVSPQAAIKRSTSVAARGVSGGCWGLLVCSDPCKPLCKAPAGQPEKHHQSTWLHEPDS